MGRAFYSHEADDRDLNWLVEEFLSEKPQFQPIETGSNVLMLVPYIETASELDSTTTQLPAEQELVAQ